MKLSDFANNYPSKKYLAEETIHTAGDDSQTLYYLKRGHVKRFVDSLDGKELIIHIFDPGSVFPLLSVFTERSFSFNLSALTNCEVILIPKKDFNNYIKENNIELLKITKNLLLGLEGMAMRVEILSLEDAKSRISSALKYLSKHFGQKLHFTHEELSALTGLSRERVSIEMKKMKDEGKIRYSRNVIYITDTSESFDDN
jgi:CRP-like cAMP-binding protein